MTRTRKILAGAGLLVAGFVTLSAFGGHGGWGGHGELTPERAQRFATFMVDNMLDDVNATPQQRTQVHALKDQRVQDVVAFSQRNRAAKTELLKEWQSNQPDAKAVHALIDQRIDDLRAMAHRMADDGLELHHLLTPPQRAELAERAESHMGIEK
jgi:protein CpxP